MKQMDASLLGWILLDHELLGDECARALCALDPEKCMKMALMRMLALITMTPHQALQAFIMQA